MQRVQSTAPALAYVNPQPKLPIRFDSKRGCDQIRARVYHDARLTGAAKMVAMVLSEFVNTATYTAHPKQANIARWAGLSRRGVIKALGELVRLGVIETDRRRTYKRYVFRAAWRDGPSPRCEQSAHHDVNRVHITGEPIQGNLEHADTPVLGLSPVVGTREDYPSWLPDADEERDRYRALVRRKGRVTVHQWQRDREARRVGA